jgi:hypothetical protein
MNNQAKNEVQPRAAPTYRNRVTLVGYIIVRQPANITAGVKKRKSRSDLSKRLYLTDFVGADERT